MEEPTIHFVAGLPRSGSTLLCNILNQNPLCWAGPTSGIIEIMLAVRNQWENVGIFKAAPNMPGKRAVLRGILQNYYSIGGPDGQGPLMQRPVLFDKNRAWPAYIEMLEFALGRKVKIICTVRDVVDILASFEKLYRRHTHIWQFPQEKTNHQKWQTTEDRADLWMTAEQPVGCAYNQLRDALKNRGLADRIHIVEFKNLTENPDLTMRHLYNFLGLEYFFHDFENVVQRTMEDDYEHGIPNLHDIRPGRGPLQQVPERSVLALTAQHDLMYHVPDAYLAIDVL